MLHTDARTRSKSPVVVKSAMRALEVVEYISGNANGATANDIIKEFNYPASSTSALLKSLCRLGYLRFERRQRIYHATARIALVGIRTLPELFAENQILKVMRRINEQTGETIILSMEVDTQVRFIHTIEPPDAEPIHLRSLGARSLMSSCSGRIFLSTLDDAQIRVIAFRHNRESPGHEGRKDISALLAEIQWIRSHGYCMSISESRPGIACVAQLVPQNGTRDKLAIIVAGQKQRIVANHRRYADTIEAAFERYLKSTGGMDVLH